MKKILLLFFLFVFTFSQNITATPVDFIKPITPTEESVQVKKKKKNFFARMTERIMKKRIGKMIKKLGLDPNDCDRIIKTNGEELDVIIVEIGAKRIRYKKCDFQNGPTRSIRKEDIFMIKYADGTKDLMTDIDALKKIKTQTIKTAKLDDDGKQYWIIGFAIGTILGLLGLLIIAVAFKGEKRKRALRGGLTGIITLFLFLITLLFLSLLIII
jgi:hypothetical protein